MIQQTFPANQWVKARFDDAVIIEADRRITLDAQQGQLRPLAEYQNEILSAILGNYWPAGNA